MIAATYARKSQDDDRDEDAKSTTRQIDRAREYAASRGWQFSEEQIYIDDGVSGAEWKDRHAFNRMLVALDSPKRPFDVLIVSELSRIGRDSVRTPYFLQQIEEAGVEVWGYLSNQRISLIEESAEISTIFNSMAASFERRRASQRVTDALRRRAERGLVAGGKVYGYTNVRENSVVRRQINEDEAPIVRRIFSETRDGHGLKKIAGRLNAEGVPGPRSNWSTTGVREILRRDLYRGVVIYGRVKRGRTKGTKTRTRVDESQWLRHEAPELQIVDGVLWDAAHAHIAQKAGAYLRRGGKLAGQVESLRGKYLLSGFLACGICNAPLIAQQRGRNLKMTYICKAHREKGGAVCANTTAAPMSRLHDAVIASLQETFSPENFERLLKTKAEDEQAQASREAERANLLARIPVLNAEAERLANAVAAGNGSLDVLLNAIKERQAEREQAEQRLAEIEADVRALREQAEAVENFRQRWGDWKGALTAEPVLARQLLRKILVGPILVLPKGRGAWEFIGGSRFDAVLHGALSPQADAVRTWSQEARARMVAVLRADFPADRALGQDAWMAAPIAGGSDGDVVGDDVRSTEMAPHTPQPSPGPAKPAPALLTAGPGSA